MLFRTGDLDAAVVQLGILAPQPLDLVRDGSFHRVGNGDAAGLEVDSAHG